ncbi:MAG TPA: tyrosine--tRNA ligase [Candidatus Limnocylindrales bacterium]|nr:tyrosine--tRNA ligase [Candidatus Limnocylindrales bacterium]
MTLDSALAGGVPGLSGLLDELTWRGMLHATTPGLPARLATGRPIAGYNGFDPSGPWLHIGHLVPIMGLVQLQRHGGRPVALVGGGTGMIGDPSGTSAERNLLDRDTLAANVGSIRGQLERFLDFSGASGALMVNNLDWLGGIGLIDWLRDVGKHFTVPYMLAKDSVQTRLDRGLSFTEFSYMLIQATDFEHLHRELGVELQMGGADQWGNITAGLELIRRRAGEGGGEAGGQAGGPEADVDSGGGHAHGLAYRLLLSQSGTKFGKTAGGDTVWLDPSQTSPYAFYQYWLNVDDRDVGTYLRWFTLLGREEIEGLEAEAAARPEGRAAQRALARDVTERAHGASALAHAEQVSEAAFSRGPIRDPAVLATLHGAVGGFGFTDADVEGGPVGVALASGLFASAGEARRAIAQGGLTIGDERIAALDAAVPAPIDGEWLVVRAGKRRLAVGRRRA